MKNKSIQDKMFAEMRDSDLFKQAHNYGNQHLETVFDRNVFPTQQAIDNLKHFDEVLPDEPSEGKAVIEQLQKYGWPAALSNIGGRYFGFVTGSVVPASMGASLMGAYWDQVSAMYVISPVCSKLETVSQGWLRDIFQLPKSTVAGFVSGSSMANFCGLAAARYRLLQRLGWDINEKGLFDAPKIRLVTGRHAHSTVLKSISLLGFGKQNIEWVDVDDQGRIIPDAIPELDDKTILILQAGNVNSGAFDNFELICEKAKAANAWVHIDGAFGLWAGAVESLKHLTKGMEKASSWAVDGHKTLNTPYDSGVILCADEEALVAALHMSAGYIVLSKERDGMFYTPEMSRRARIIELWAAMRYLGKKGIDEMVLGFHLRAKQFAHEISRIPGFKVLNEVVFNQVLIECETEELTEKTIERIQELRECWVGGSTWFGKRVIRVSVCAWTTTAEDITRSVKSFEKALGEVGSGQ